MTIGTLIAFQLVFDLLLVVMLITVARQRRAPLAPPAWHDEFLQLAKEVMAVADTLLDAAPERRRSPVSPRDERASAKSPMMRPASPTPRPAVSTSSAAAARPVSARDEAFALLRGGMEPDAVARRTGLLPGELRLITSLVAAQRRGNAPEPRQALPTSEVRRRGGAAEPADFPELKSLAGSGTGLA